MLCRPLGKLDTAGSARLAKPAGAGDHPLVPAAVLGLVERGVGARQQALQRLAGMPARDARRHRDAMRGTARQGARQSWASMATRMRSVASAAASGPVPTGISRTNSSPP